MLVRVLRPIALLCIGMLIFIGLPMVGWGWSDLGGFFADRARELYCGVVLVLMTWSVAVVPDSGRGKRVGKQLVKRQHVALMIMQFLSLAAVVIAPYCDRRSIAIVGDAAAIRYIGLGLFAIGYLVMNWAVIALDRQFSVEVTIQENHQLITTGPYRLVRHPRYLGIVLFLVGLALVFRSWAGLLLAGIMLLVLIWRIHDEEKLLHQQFGDLWEQYCQKTRRIIPGLL